MAFAAPPLKKRTILVRRDADSHRGLSRICPQVRAPTCAPRAVGQLNETRTILVRRDADSHRGLSRTWQQLRAPTRGRHATGHRNARAVVSSRTEPPARPPSSGFCVISPRDNT